MKKPICLHFCKTSQLIKDISGSGNETYNITFFYCNKMRIKIKRKDCKTCNLYNPLINHAGKQYNLKDYENNE